MADVAPITIPAPSPEVQAAIARRVDELEDEALDVALQFKVHADVGENLSQRAAESIIKHIAHREVVLGLEAPAAPEAVLPDVTHVVAPADESPEAEQARLERESAQTMLEIERRVIDLEDQGYGDGLMGALVVLLDPKIDYTEEERRRAITDHVLSVMAARDIKLEREKN
jgi:hypothetical protein